MTYLYSWSLAYVSSTLGPSSSLKLLLVFMKEIQKIVTNKHKHSQMMSEICRLVEHASWTTKDASFPKNISTFNCLVKYFPVLIFLFFKEALFPLMYFVVFFFHCQITQLLGSLPNSLGSLFHGLTQDGPF